MPGGIVLKFDITYKRFENNDIVIIIIYALYGIIKYKIELPFLDFIKKMDRFTMRFRIRFQTGKEVKDKIEFKRAESIDEFIDDINNLAEKYKLYKKSIDYMIKRIYIKDFVMDLSFGFDDAYITGVSYGIFYTFLASLAAYIKGHLNLDIKSVNLKPVFNKYVFDLVLNCIIDIKIGHIITGLAKFIKTSRGSEIDGTTHSGSYENNYGKY